MATPHNLYIHVPFCASKCNYCAFHSTACAPDWEKYADGIIRDIEYWAKRMPFQIPGSGCASPGMTPVPTIFFGGGTPSLMPVSIFVRIMDAVRANFDVAAGTEVTLESNPGTLNAARLSEFIAAGVNRLSIGVQSLDNEVLKFLGRRHSAQDARELIRYAQSAGIRVSGDFIYGLPGQTVRDVRKMCRDILELGLSHASLYELSIEPGTPFAKREIKVPADEVMAEMYQAIGEGFLPRYEISNYAAPGSECRHNQNIWAGQPYIGIGPSAAGRILIDGNWYEQDNPKNISDWMKTLPGHYAATPLMEGNTRAVEKIITGLRTTRGVELTDDVRSVIDWEFINSNPEYFLLTTTPSSANADATPSQCEGELTFVSVSNKGILILDSLLTNVIK